MEQEHFCLLIFLDFYVFKIDQLNTQSVFITRNLSKIKQDIQKIEEHGETNKGWVQTPDIILCNKTWCGATHNITSILNRFSQSAS